MGLAISSRLLITPCEVGPHLAWTRALVDLVPGPVNICFSCPLGWPSHPNNES